MNLEKYKPIIFSLLDGPKTRKQLLKETGLKESTLYKYLDELIKEGYIEKIPKRKYGSYRLAVEKFSFLEEFKLRVYKIIEDNIVKNLSIFDNHPISQYIFLENPSPEIYKKIEEKEEEIINSVKKITYDKFLPPGYNLIKLLIWIFLSIQDIINPDKRPTERVSENEDLILIKSLPQFYPRDEKLRSYLKFIRTPSSDLFHYLIEDLFIKGDTKKAELDWAAIKKSGDGDLVKQRFRYILYILYILYSWEEMNKQV